MVYYKYFAMSDSCIQLNIQNFFKNKFKPPIDTSNLYQERFEPKDNSEMFNDLNDWLQSLNSNIRIEHGSYFYLPPNKSFPPHIDDKFTDWVKINFLLNGNGGSVRWWKNLDNSTSLQNKSMVTGTVTHGSYETFEQCKLKEIDNHVHPTVCLFNGGKIHSFEAGDCVQELFSVILTLQTGRHIPWSVGKKLFADFLCE